MTVRLQRVVWWTRQGLLTGGAVLGVVCILLTLGSALFGLRPLVFESGSMSPTIATGALAISHRVDAQSLDKGQIVSVPTETGARVTHRIVKITHEGDAAVLRLRGDANEATDNTTYTVTHADRVLFDVPGIGYAVAWLSGPAGLFLLGLYAAFLLSVLLKGSPGARPPAPPTSDGAGTSRKVLAGGLSVVLMTGAAAGLIVHREVTPTLAAFTDPVDVSGTTLGSATVGVPGAFTCRKTTGATTLTWTPVSPVTNYSVYSSSQSAPLATITATSYVLTPPASGTLTAWVVANRTFGPVTWTSAETAHLAYQANGQC